MLEYRDETGKRLTLEEFQARIRDAHAPRGAAHKCGSCGTLEEFQALCEHMLEALDAGPVIEFGVQCTTCQLNVAPGPVDIEKAEHRLRVHRACNPTHTAHLLGICPNCAQWRYPTSTHAPGYVDCVNDCVARGFAPKAAAETLWL